MHVEVSPKSHVAQRPVESRRSLTGGSCAVLKSVKAMVFLTGNDIWFCRGKSSVKQCKAVLGSETYMK